MKRNISLFCILLFSAQTFGMIINHKEEATELFTIPHEVVSIIATKLDYKTNIRFIRVSKKLYTYFKDQDAILMHNHFNSDDHTNAMIYCARQNDEKKIAFLIEHEGNINKKNRESVLSYFKVENSNDVEKIIEIYQKEYKKESFPANTLCDDFIENIPVLDLFLKQGCSPNAMDKGGYTMYNSAVCFNHPKLLRFLLANGGIDYDINIVGDAIVSCKGDDNLKILLADPRANQWINDNGAILLHYCINFKDCIEKFKILLAEVDPNLQDDTGMTSLHLAVLIQNKDIIRLLLADARVDQTIKDDRDKTALHYVLDWRAQF